MGDSAFDGRMIGLYGKVVVYPQWFFALLINTQRRLSRIANEIGKPVVKIVERDKPSGLWQVLPAVKEQLGDLLDLPNYNPRRALRAFDPSYHSGRPRHCGRRGLIDLLESGIDETRDLIRECEADLEITRMSQVLVQQLLEEVRQSRPE